MVAEECVCWLTQGDIVTQDVTPHASFLLKQAQQNYKWSEVKWRERGMWKTQLPSWVLQLCSGFGSTQY